MSFPGFKMYKDRSGNMRCYHRKTATAVDLKKYPLGSDQFFDHCKRLSGLLSAKTEERRQTYVYLFKSSRQVKIGISHDVPSRFKHLRSMTDKKIKISAFTLGTYDDEKSLHARFKQYRRTGEWFYVRDELAEFMRKPYENLVSHIKSNTDDVLSAGGEAA